MKGMIYAALRCSAEYTRWPQMSLTQILPACHRGRSGRQVPDRLADVVSEQESEPRLSDRATRSLILSTIDSLIC
mgnify:CR=1 FL=1